MHNLCVALQFSSSFAGEKHAQNKPRRAKHAQHLQAFSSHTHIEDLRVRVRICRVRIGR